MLRDSISIRLANVIAISRLAYDRHHHVRAEWFATLFTWCQNFEIAIDNLVTLFRTFLALGPDVVKKNRMAFSRLRCQLDLCFGNKLDLLFRVPEFQKLKDQ